MLESDMADKRRMESAANGLIALQPAMAECALPLLAATDARAVAAALLRGLAACGVPAVAVVWQAQDHVACEPVGALPPDQERLHLSDLLATLGSVAHPLHAGSAGPQAAVLMASEAPVPLPPAPALLLELAGQRLVELLTLQQLQASVLHLEQSRQLQQALFAMADLASSDQDMDSMLRGLHEIIGRLMYARNFFIALLDPQRDSLRFIYFADEVDDGMYEGLAKFKTATWRKHFGAQYLSTLRLSGRMRSAIASIPPWVTRSAPSQGVANRFRS